MLKDELEAIINSDNGWAAKSTLILALGILGEYTVLPFFEHAKISLVGLLLKSRRPTELRSIVHRWQKKLKLVFAFMVLGGVVGEYEFSSRIGRNADRLQQISDQEIADVNQNAAEANERSNKLVGENFALQAKVLELRRLIADRTISDAQALLIRTSLRPLGAQEFTLVTYDARETVAIAVRIRDILVMAGWTFIAPRGRLIGADSGVLVYASATADAPVKRAAHTVVSALTGVGITAEFREKPDDPPKNRIEIIVGTKL